MAKCVVKSIKDYKVFANNKIIVKDPNTFSMLNSSITFEDKASNNLIFIDENVSIADSRLVFFGSNSIIYLSKSKHPYKLSVDIFNKSVLYFGCHNYISGIIEISLSEEQNIIIGNDNLFARSISFRASDAHYVFDIQTMQPINVGKSIMVGDHVWVGQNALILKGTHIGSGSIVGAYALASGKIIPSNESWAGNPAKSIKKGVFFLKNCVHTYTSFLRETMLSRQNDVNDFIFKKTDDTMDMTLLDSCLKNEQDPNKKMLILHQLNQNTIKDRFFI